jgi:phosphatidylserine decarboxylase
VGLVAMIEVVALMIGDIVQCVSTHRYDHPQPLARSMRLCKGAPKSLFRPGSSTVILLFQQGAVRFSEDLVHNLARVDVASRFSAGLGRPLVETEVRVRETIARREPLGPAPPADPPAPAPSTLEDA